MQMTEVISPWLMNKLEHRRSVCDLSLSLCGLTKNGSSTILLNVFKRVMCALQAFYSCVVLTSRFFAGNYFLEENIMFFL